MTEIQNRLEALLQTSGAARTAFLEQPLVRYDRSFRELCLQNRCRQYGACYMCPPDVGDIDAVIAQARAFPHAALYQTVHALQDSFDMEGMAAAKKRHDACELQIQRGLPAIGLQRWLHLGGGSCSLCERCAKLDGLPCRWPQDAVPSLSAYGVHVSETAAAAGLPYNNGQNTVTYFGLILYAVNDDV